MRFRRTVAAVLVLCIALFSACSKAAAPAETKALSTEEKAEIIAYIESRYDYYDEQDGKPTGNKYTDQIWQEAAEKYSISKDEVNAAWEDEEAWQLYEASKEPEDTGSDTNLVPFAESEVYRQLVDTINDKMAEWNPQCAYDEKSNSFVVVVPGLAGTINSIENNLEEDEETWRYLEESLVTLSQSAYDAIRQSGYDVNCLVAYLSDEDPSDIVSEAFNGQLYRSIFTREKNEG